MKIINLTGHQLDLAEGSKMVVLPPDGKARMENQTYTIFKVQVGNIRIPVLRIVESGVIDLPSPTRDTLYVVSGIVANAVRRRDVVMPGRAYWEDKGIISRALIQIATEVRE